TERSASPTDTSSYNLRACASTLRTISNSPRIIELTVIPVNFSNCATSLLQVTVEATCNVAASQCKGSYTGLVQVRQPVNYRDLAANLQVNIIAGYETRK